MKRLLPVSLLLVFALVFAADARALENNGFTKKVLGYHLSWRQFSDVESRIPWTHYTHLSYFAVAANADGSLGCNNDCADPGQPFKACWTPETFLSLVQMGHQHDVKVGLSLVAALNPDGTTNPSWIHSFLSKQVRTRLVNNIVARVTAAGADGVDVDIEWPQYSDASNYAAFVKALTTAVHAARPGSYVFVSVPAWDYPPLGNYATLAANSDALTIMGYGYHGEFGGSEPGPVAPIRAGTRWTMPPYDLTQTLDYYAGLGISTSKLLLGFPIYGTDWPTTSNVVPGTWDMAGNPPRPMKFPVVRDNFYPAPVATDCETQLTRGKRWDSVSQTPYFVYQENGWRQLFCEDLASMTAKYQLAKDWGVAGIFIWAENYLPHDYPFWRLNDKFFRQTPPANQAPAASITSQTLSGSALSFTASASDPDGDPLLLEWVWTGPQDPPLDVAAGNRTTFSTTLQRPGNYTFNFTASDGLATASDTRIIFVPGDSTPPTVAITPAPPALVGGNVQVNVGASDINGVQRVELVACGSAVQTATAAPYVFTWPSGSVADGSCILQATAYDWTDLTATDSKQTIVDNTNPTVSFISPAGASAPSPMLIEVQAGDANGVTKVEFSVNGVLKQTLTAAPWRWTWTAPNSQRGKPATLSAKAYDPLNHTTTATKVVTVQ